MGKILRSLNFHVSWSSILLCVARFILAKKLFKSQKKLSSKEPDDFALYQFALAVNKKTLENGEILSTVQLFGFPI